MRICYIVNFFRFLFRNVCILFKYTFSYRIKGFFLRIQNLRLIINLFVFFIIVFKIEIKHNVKKYKKNLNNGLK